VEALAVTEATQKVIVEFGWFGEALPDKEPGICAAGKAC
jgi:hypothetical protein